LKFLLVKQFNFLPKKLTALAEAKTCMKNKGKSDVFTFYCLSELLAQDIFINLTKQVSFDSLILFRFDEFLTKIFPKKHFT